MWLKGQLPASLPANSAFLSFALALALDLALALFPPASATSFFFFLPLVFCTPETPHPRDKLETPGLRPPRAGHTALVRAAMMDDKEAPPPFGCTYANTPATRLC